MKHVLMVTFSWPPRGGTGGWRPLKFAKYLPRYGWQPAVVAATGWGSLDRRWLPPESTPECRAIGVPPWGEMTVARSLSQLLSPLLSALGTTRADFEETLCWRTRSWLDFPDPGTGFNRWILPMAFAAAREARRRRYDAIYVTSPPDGMALAAGILARLTLRPVVIDFRDPWTLNFQDFYHGFARRLSDVLEGWSVRPAARLITVTGHQARDLARLYPAAAARIRTIPNGFDHEDMIHGPRVPDGRCVVTLMGTSYEDFRHVLQAIRLAAAADADFSRLFRFRWIGAKPSAADQARQLGVEANVELLDRQPHDEALRLAARSDALWLEVVLQPNAEYVHCSKAFEYLGLERPIIGTVPRSSASWALVAPVGAERLIESRDPAAIARLFADVFADWKAGRLQVRSNAEYVSRFRRDVLTGQLAAVLDEVA